MVFLHTPVHSLQQIHATLCVEFFSSAFAQNINEFIPFTVVFVCASVSDETPPGIFSLS
ncbi:hypothetical protein BDZ85DRAFT_260223 [Elsinoe ampelina]|uniref:Uncharacterized protein n=1 Tax=Elsinoe ampelina TaxID=302913 RepID=A0A6A6GE68_9PEZI|nr:hypothetical protein BDZ85DRAFT_260223 [Elsinoe ampelina]